MLSAPIATVLDISPSVTVWVATREADGTARANRHIRRLPATNLTAVDRNCERGLNGLRFAMWRFINMSRRRRGKADPLKRMIAQINRTKQPSKREERASTANNASVRSYDLTASDPYLVDIIAKSEDRDPIKAINEIGKGIKAKTWAQKAKASIRGYKARQAEQDARFTAAPTRPIRREIPEPMPLIMAPELPPLKDGKPNIAALVYAYRAFLQYSHAFNRRRLGDTREREVYYQTRRTEFQLAMKDAGLYDYYDWTDIGV